MTQWNKIAPLAQRLVFTCEKTEDSNDFSLWFFFLQIKKKEASNALWGNAVAARGRRSTRWKYKHWLGVWRGPGCTAGPTQNNEIQEQIQFDCNLTLCSCELWFISLPAVIRYISGHLFVVISASHQPLFEGLQYEYRSSALCYTWHGHACFWCSILDPLETRIPILKQGIVEYVLFE